ncbi:MAG: hypothetical protein KGI29_10160, partial [Pseudomonadota bacterium]|nr:hypothetical protein [Pseudomonadota bacterium]
SNVGTYGINALLGTLSGGGNYTISVSPTPGVLTISPATNSLISFPSNEIVNQSLQNNNFLPTSLFSYAGHTIAGSVTVTAYNFTIQNTNLSLLAAGGGTVQATTPQQLNNLAPAAGGDIASQFAMLAPAAGSGVLKDCADGFLADALNNCTNTNQ